MRAFFRFVFRTLAIAFICSAAVPLTVVVVVLASFIFLPLPANLPTPKAVEAGRVSRVYDVNGQEIGQFREFEQSIPVKPADIPLILKQAVISSEDKNFYQHGGIDVRGTARALYEDLHGNRISQGGSTITQQYVKNTYVGKDRTITRKVREAVVASQLDRQIDKDEILFKYLDTVYLGSGAYGVGAASETYFRKPVSQLTPSEAALLVGVIPAPSRYEPRKNPENAETKRKIVLAKMRDQGYLTPAQYDESVAQTLYVVGKDLAAGPHTVVYPAQDQVNQYPYFMDYVEKYLKAKYGAKLVDTGGLRIQTTLDPQIQGAAQLAINEELKNTKTATIDQDFANGPHKGDQTPLESSLVSIEPQTGFVKALIGGRDFYAPGGQVNLALGKCPNHPPPNYKVEVDPTCWALEQDGTYVEGGGSGRQPGSSFKPFVLAAAFEKGVPPTKVYPAPNQYRVPDCKVTKNFDCTIGNYEGESFGSSDLRGATVHSINTVYAQLVRDVGCKETGEMAKKLGVTSAWYSSTQHTCSGSYALGVLDVSPLEMASAYATFANRGLHQEPTPVVRVEDANGKVLEDNRRREPTRVLDEVVADNVTDVLRGVITGGTGTKANIGRPAAGKTGTSQASKNAWFVGYTPTLSTAVWLGFRDEPIPMYGIKGCAKMTGGCLAAPTWKAYMSAALKDVPVTDFNQPAPIKLVQDKISKAARTGIDPGPQRRVEGTGIGGPYIVGPSKPSVDAPTTTTAPPSEGSGSPPPSTTTTAKPAATTTTTRPLVGGTG